MLPYVHDENWDETSDISNFMQRDPMVREPTVCWILATHRPPDTSHFPDAHEVGLPNIVAAEARVGGLTKCRVAAAFVGASYSEVLKVKFMQHHAVVLESQTAG